MGKKEQKETVNRLVDYALAGMGLVLICISLGIGAWVLGNRTTAVAEPPLKILFLGNSYTYYNDLDRLFTQLAASEGHPVQAERIAPGGWQLVKHLNTPSTISRIQNGSWDYVVLQEQSIVPTMIDERTQHMYPSIRAFNQLLTKQGAQPILFMTWGRRNAVNQFANYTEMQTNVSEAYMGIANQLNMPVAPVGIAWREAWLQDPIISLWGSDGSHPSPAGSYLAACVFYAAIYQESPEGADFLGGLKPRQAETLQRIAAETVLNDLEQWHIAPNEPVVDEQP